MPEINLFLKSHLNFPHPSKLVILILIKFGGLNIKFTCSEEKFFIPIDISEKSTSIKDVVIEKSSISIFSIQSGLS